MKGHIHSIETNARRDGFDLSVDGVVDWLGLHELQQPSDKIAHVLLRNQIRERMVGGSPEY